ncbi:MAG TPA: NHL repeat-containing protein [Sedimentisphaerales bacterium]|nr:NHL repeat-containing protein [Sedimentisphaerales bacterium]
MNKQLGMANIKIFTGVLIAVAAVIAVFALMWLDTTGEKGSGLGKAFEYDIKELAKIDPNLILYKESAEAIDTGLKASHGIAVGSDGRIYVAGDNAIRVFGQGGDLLSEIPVGGMPRCLAAADDGRIYVGVKDHVEIYDGQGKRLAAWQSLGEDAVLTSVAVSGNDVFVADAGNRIVTHHDVGGKLINRIGKKDKDKNIPGFLIPSPYFDLAVGRDGLLRVVNPGLHRIEAYTFEGDLEFSWGRFSSHLDGFTGCCNPVNFAILGDGSFVTCEKGLVRVKIYDADGAFVGVVAGPEQLVAGGASRVCEFPSECQAGGFDVAVDAAGRIFVLDTIKNVVRIFSRIKAE